MANLLTSYVVFLFLLNWKVTNTYHVEVTIVPVSVIVNLTKHGSGAYLLPFVSDIFEKLRNARCLFSLDIKSAYWHIPKEERINQNTTLTVPKRSLFQFCHTPFGLTNAPATWQRVFFTAGH